MKKLKLNLDEIKVESFETIAEKSLKKGTLFGQVSDLGGPCGSISGPCTCDGYSCGYSDCPQECVTYDTCYTNCPSTCPWHICT